MNLKPSYIELGKRFGHPKSNYEPSTFVAESSSLSDSSMAMLDPIRLAGLKQATYVLQCLTKGQSEEQIANTMGDDKQLVKMWAFFLTHNHWMIREGEGWSTTAKGAEWSSRRTPETT